MNVLDTVTEGLRIARSSKSLWLFGLFVGLGSSGGGGGQGGPPSPPPDGAPADGSVMLLIALVVAAVAIAALIMRVLSEGALIEGVKRARRGERLSVGEGFREGWAHFGTVLLIDVVYLATTVGSVVLLAAPCLVAAQFIDTLPAVLILGVPAVVIGVPWLVTLYIWQAFATRIAVLENRRAIDAIRKARLFLHGRLLHGLKLIVAMLLGTLLVMLVSAIVLVPLGLLVAGSFALGGAPLAVALGLLLLVPAVAVLAAIVGTYQSSVWTIGYLTEVEA